MSEIMTFPETVEEFMEQYKVVDTEKVYTSGIELVPIFRMKQWFEHLPAVPHEMTAREYGKTLMKICASHKGSCYKCELGKNKPCMLPIERTTIPIVEAWVREHPEERSEQ